MKNRIFRGRLSFSKAEMQKASLGIGSAGVNMPIPINKDWRQSYESEKDWLEFGSLFGSMNDAKYYDNVTAKSLMPKKEDFVEAPFRLISATTVGGGSWKATDFSEGLVLQESYRKLEGKPLYKDHETDLDNWVGLVTGVKWGEGFTDSTGVKIPAGIDGVVAIDAKTNPKVARGVLMGSIFSNSVTVDFDWRMSHDFSSMGEFMDRVGTFGDDGKMIRRIATKIYDYYESSLVWLGADPFAKAHTMDGGLQHVDVSSVYEYAKASFKKDVEKYSEESDKNKQILENKHKYVINFGIDKNVLSLAQRKQVQDQDPPKPKKMKKFIAAFILAFGAQFNLKEGDEVTEDQLVEFMKKLKFSDEEKEKEVKAKLGIVDKVQSLALEVAKKEDEKIAQVDMPEFLKDKTFIGTNELTELQKNAEAVETLTKEKAALEAEAKVGKEYIDLKRNEAIRLYKVAVGEDNSEEAVINLFKAADSSAIEGLLKQYAKNATGKFSGSCSDCGSKNFKFQSSLTVTGQEGSEQEEDNELTATDLYNKYSKPSIHIGRTTKEADAE